MNSIEYLRSLCRQYFKLSDELTAYKNRLIGVMDEMMLNFSQVFKNVCSLTSLAILEKYPSPDQMLKARKSDFIKLIQKTSYKSEKWATHNMNYC
jgi:hypothetical protein